MAQRPGSVTATLPVLPGRPPPPYRFLVLGLLQGLADGRQLGTQPGNPPPAQGGDSPGGPLRLRRHEPGCLTGRGEGGGRADGLPAGGLGAHQRGVGGQRFRGPGWSGRAAGGDDRDSRIR